MLRRILLALAEQKWLHRVIVETPAFRRMARRFVAGERLEEAVAAVRRLNQVGITATLDCLGESVATVAEAEEARDEYLRVLDCIVAEDLACNVSLKLTQMGYDVDRDLCFDNVRRILARAQEHGNFVRLDMEGSAYTGGTLDLHERLWQEHHNVGVVIQSYLHRSPQDIDHLNRLGARVRLCKGAYNEPPQVAFARKADTDANYQVQAQKLLLGGHYPALATHDARLIDHVKFLARTEGVDPSTFEFQMLYGIRRDLQQRLVEEGYRVRVYVPYGTHWYPYFMRRLAERPANLAFFLSSLLR